MQLKLEMSEILKSFFQNFEFYLSSFQRLYLLCQIYDFKTLKSSMFWGYPALKPAYTLFSHQNINFNKYQCDF